MQTGLASGGGLVLRLPAPRAGVVVPALAAVAALAAAALSYAQPPVHRAEATVVVGRGLAPPADAGERRALAATAAALVRSNVVAGNVIQALRLDETPGHLLGRLHVSTRADGSALTLAVDDPDPAEAQRVAQEVGLVFAQLVKQRFGADGTTATVFDPPHLRPGRVPPPALRNALLAAAATLLAGGALAALRDRRLRPVPAVPAKEPAPPPAPVPEPEPLPAPEPAPDPEPPLPPAAAGALDLAELERRVAAAREAADPDRLAEWDAYLDSLRAHARPDGTLPPPLEPLARDVFADLLASERMRA